MRDFSLHTNPQGQNVIRHLLLHPQQTFLLGVAPEHQKSQVIIESCHTRQRTALSFTGIRQLWERTLLPKEHSSLDSAPISCSGLETSSSCIFLRTPMIYSVYNAYVVHTPAALRETDGAEDREVGKLHEILSYLCHNMTLGRGL